jgi:hypothetical protein
MRPESRQSIQIASLSLSLMWLCHPNSAESQDRPAPYRILAVRDRVDAFPSFDDKAHGGIGMAMGVDSLAGFHELDRHIQSVS